MTQSFTPIFAPQARPIPTGAGAKAGDVAPAGVYLFSEDIVLAINVALATGRPLLVRGTSGCGKTSLARSTAEQLGARYYEGIVTARTQARDLLWTVDLLRRLQDAQTGNLSVEWHSYITPGPLWWAFDGKSARDQQLRARSGSPPPGDVVGSRAVLLIDEIDKADPDVPNALLRPLGDLAFTVEETGTSVTAQLPSPLIIITTNDDRDLPPAFLRRCVELNIAAFDQDRLIGVGRAHFPGTNEDLLKEAAKLVVQGGSTRERREPNPAEYLDILRACHKLQIDAKSPMFQKLTQIALGSPPPSSPNR
jgi:MoxR-like ATPase